jgi:hypothetical protein
MIDLLRSPEAHEPSYRGTEGCGPAICKHVRGRRKGVSYFPFNWSFNRQIITLSNIKVQEHETFASDRPCMLNRLVVREKSAPPALCKDRFQKRSARFMKVSLIGSGILKHGSETRTLFHFLVLLQYGLREETNFPEYKAGKPPTKCLSQSFPASDCHHHPRCAWAKSYSNFNCPFINFCAIPC